MLTRRALCDIADDLIVQVAVGVVFTDKTTQSLFTDFTYLKVLFSTNNPTNT